MPLIWRNADLLAKVEATAGTAEALVAGDGTFPAYVEGDPFAYEIPVDDRPAQQGMGQARATAGSRSGRLRFAVDLVGLGSAGSPAWATTLFPMCGMTNSSNTFQFNALVTPGTLALYVDGTVYKLVGAVGNWTVNLRAGHAAKVEFEFLGKLADDADASLPSTTKTTTLPPRWAGTAVSIGAFSPVLATATINAGNELIMREDESDATGFISGWIVDRRTTIGFDPEATTVASRDWLTQLKNSTTEAVSIAVGSAANNTQTFAAAAAHTIAAGLGNRNKIVTRAVEMLCTGTTGSSSPLTLAFA